MKIKKVGLYKWHYSRFMAWSLQRHFGHENVETIEWQIPTKIKETEYVCPFVAELINAGRVKERISGKAIYINDYVQLIISDRIRY